MRLAAGLSSLQPALLRPPPSTSWRQHNGWDAAEAEDVHLQERPHLYYQVKWKGLM
jgi:hypothetical protein